MRKYLIVFNTLLMCINAAAQLNINENFTGMTSGDLGGQNSWTSGAINDVQVIARSNNLGALTYPNYTSGTSSIRTDGTAGADPVKAFVSNVGISSNSYTYISFLVNVSTANNEATSLPTVALRTALGSNLCYFYIARDGSDVKFGISKSEGGTGDGEYRTQNYLLNTTYLIVIGYSLTTGSNNDVISLYVNPTLGTLGPSGSPLTISSGSDGGYSGAISGLQIFQNRTTPSFTTYSTADAQFDAFRVASGANSTEAWTNLSPLGAILPVTISSIKAYEKNAGIQLDWTVHSEMNISRYEIERSTDGRSFATIGQVAAANTNAVKNYSFFDANPLSGTSFYRLRNIDIDASSKYSNVIRVSLERGEKDITVYPNPVTNGIMSIQSADLLKGNYNLTLYNLVGQKVYSYSFNHSGGAINHTIQLQKRYTTGVYKLVVNNKVGDIVMAKQIIIQ
jgi:Secretion system C-terminal sorting domain